MWVMIKEKMLELAWSGLEACFLVGTLSPLMAVLITTQVDDSKTGL
jgi:hypothetical protein